MLYFIVRVLCITTKPRRRTGRLALLLACVTDPLLDVGERMKMRWSTALSQARVSQYSRGVLAVRIHKLSRSHRGRVIRRSWVF